MKNLTKLLIVAVALVCAPAFAATYNVPVGYSANADASFTDQYGNPGLTTGEWIWETDKPEMVKITPHPSEPNNFRKKVISVVNDPQFKDQWAKVRVTAQTANGPMTVEHNLVAAFPQNLPPTSAQMNVSLPFLTPVSP